ncbi:semaphorin-7A-like isoform X2 [Brienomyrus brachyistius]|uniref:semaphorin-7A-like isoform X2 n=1 Tax=Brienomyrus brachyistius TaxID=42636 RepID=UPI0020B1C560|nr:semaphorin-7A-like isoform X2 [Brienomyrus brachyistius]
MPLKFLKKRFRVIITEKDCVARKCVLLGTQNSTRMELLQGPKPRTVYAGVGGRLFYLDFRENCSQNETLVFRNSCSNSCSRNTSSCDYDITLLHEHKNGSALFICGTNGITPVCCSVSRETGFCNECLPARAVSPVSVHEHAPSLYLGEELYTTANRVKGGNHVGIRRHFGHQASIWPSDNVTEQNYVALVASPRPNKIQDRIYAFLVQRNADQHREADLWVPLVTQVCQPALCCQADLGGPKSFFQRSWTSHLSALLSCGIAEKKLYFNRLLDVAVLEQDNWKDSMVYGLFSNGWGTTAVCVFTMGDIDYVFTNSPFKGYTDTVPHPRPGTCVVDSTKLPLDVLRLVKDHPEMKDWVRPVNNSDPIVVSHHHQYKDIRVDRVNTSLGASYHVILLTLGSGRVHKVLEQADHAFLIAELRPFASRCHIRNVLLQPHTKMLYVSSSSEVVELDLRSCQAYGLWCEDCVMARDPYCGWNGTHCAPVTSSAIQDVKHGNPQLCTQQYVIPSIPQKVKQHTSHFLRCSVPSTHATYTWYHNGSTVKSHVTDGQCLLLIEAMDPSMAGTYRCNASETSYTKVVVEYKLSIESKVQGLAPTYLLLYLLSLTLSSMSPQDL